MCIPYSGMKSNRGFNLGEGKKTTSTAPTMLPKVMKSNGGHQGSPFHAKGESHHKLTGKYPIVEKIPRRRITKMFVYI